MADVRSTAARKMEQQSGVRCCRFERFAVKESKDLVSKFQAKQLNQRHGQCNAELCQKRSANSFSVAEEGSIAMIVSKSVWDCAGASRLS